MPDTFDMPATGTWEQRGGWVVRQLVTDLDLNTVQATGIVGNLGYESVGFTKLQEVAPTAAGSRGGFGWAQWTGPRRRQYEAYCQNIGLDPRTDQANYGFLLVELRGAYSNVVTALKRAATLHDCVALVERLYERPAESRVGERLKWAQRALNGAQATGEPIADAMLPQYRAIVAAAEALQQMLKGAGLYAGAIDGDLGPLSRAAINRARELSS